MIYLDNAATSITKPQVVIDAVVQAMQGMGNPGRGANTAALNASRMVYETRQKLSDMFGAQGAENVAFTANVTESLNTAINGTLTPNDHVICTQLEHNSVLRPLYRLQQKGMEISFIPTDEVGNPQLEDINSMLKSNTKAIICTHGSNLTGNLVDIKAVGKIAKDNHLLFIVDAAQTAGVVEINMTEMGIDVLCITGHKGLMAPQGTGVIIVKKGVKISPLKVGGSGVHSFSTQHPTDMPTALEAGTLNTHGIAGLNAAIDYVNQIGINSIYKKELSLMWRFYNGIKNVEHVKIYGDFSTQKRAPIVALNIKKCSSAEISDILFQDYDIATRAGAHCAPLMHKAFKTEEQGMVRFSFGYFNTNAEADVAVKAVKEIAKDC